MSLGSPQERRSLECSEGSASWGVDSHDPGGDTERSCPGAGGTAPVLGLGGSRLGPRDLESVIIEQWRL